MELDASGGGATLELAADRPLVWTSFRNAVGDLVIELPNSVPGAGVDDLTPEQGLIANVDVEMFDDADRPLTRIVVHTREPSEHSLAGEGETLRLQMLPVDGGEAVALTYEPVDDPSEAGQALGAYETAAGEDLRGEDLRGEDPAASDRAMGTMEGAFSQSIPMLSFGTADAPLIGPAPIGVPATQLFAVDVLSAGDKVVIQVSGDGEFRFSSFKLENPNRFVVDLDGVVNTSARAMVAVSGGPVDRIRIGQFRPGPDAVTRVVFDLDATVPLAIESTADGLVVSFGVGSKSSMEAADQVVAVQDDPIEETMGSLADDQPMPATMDKEVAEVDLAGYEPEDLEASADPSIAASDNVTSDAGNPSADGASGAAAVPVYEPAPMASMPSGEALAMAGDPDPAPPTRRPPPRTRDVAQFEAQEVQVPKDEEEEVNPILVSLGTLVVSRQEREYVGEPIDMSLKKADLVETLRSFATISDLNFVIQPGVTGSVTVELKGVPWDQAMEQILKINNLGMDIDGTIVRIAPMSQLRTEAEEQRRLAQARQQSVPLRTVLKSLSYSNATEVATLLRNRTGSILSSRGTVQVDRRTNTLIIRELPEFVDTVLAVIDNLDAPEPQVSIEARIIEATKSFSRSLGIQWDFDYDANQASGNTTGLAFPSNVDVAGGVGLLTGGNNGLLNFTLGNILNTFSLDAQLQIAESEGLVNLVSAPRVTTLNNTSAMIQSGVQIPIQTVINNTVSVQFINATLQLQVVPQVTAEGTIMMDIQVAKRSPQPGLAITGSTNSPISTREARTKVIVRDGGTAVIGGIYEVSSNQLQDRLPGLASIPILGHLFKNRNRQNSNDELMIFITPRIVQM
jgi:type IV pilus assembly protein PilQ